MAFDDLLRASALPAYGMAPRRRLRQCIVGLGLLAYLALFAAGVAALLSLALPTGEIALATLELGAVLAAACIVLAGAGAVRGRHPDAGGAAVEADPTRLVA